MTEQQVRQVAEHLKRKLACQRIETKTRCMGISVHGDDLEAVIAGDAKHAEKILRWAKEIEIASRPKTAEETDEPLAKWKVKSMGMGPGFEKAEDPQPSCDNCGLPGTSDCPKMGRVSTEAGKHFNVCDKHSWASGQDVAVQGESCRQCTVSKDDCPVHHEENARRDWLICDAFRPLGKLTEEEKEALNLAEANKS
jgi:hypothetical protein